MVAWLIIFMVFVFWEVLALNFFAFSERRRMHLRTRSSNACSEWVVDGEEELRQLLKRVWSVVQSSREHAPRPPHTTKLWFLYLSATSFSVPTFMWVINHLDNWSAILIPSWLKKKKQKLNPRPCTIDIWDIAAFRGCFHFYNSVKKLWCFPLSCLLTAYCIWPSAL